MIPFMKILVTGAAGFIGGHVVRTLAAAGHQVAGLDKRPVAPSLPCTKILLDIQEGAALAEAAQGCDAIYHLAAVASVPRSIEDPEGTFADNVTGTRNVFEAAYRAGSLPVVYASSAAIYGDNQNLPLKETETPKPLSPYAEHKLANEHDAARYGMEYGLPTFGVRFFNIFGPGQDPSSPYSGVISIFHERLATGKPITIYGDGLQTRDFVYVGDAVQAMMAGMKNASPLAPVANVCRGETVTLLELLQTLAGIMGQSPSPAFAPARAGDIRHSCGDPARLSGLTGFQPSILLKDGLAQLV